MPRTLLLATSLFLFLLAHSCSKNTTDPPPNGGPDTTSHNFMWQIDTLGPLTTTLSDVAFISETEAWAVGRIQFVDSAGTNRLYGLAKQDGALWNFQEIEKARNDALLNIRGIFALEHNDIWLAAGSVYHWTGGPYAALSWQRDITSQEIARSVWSDRNDHIYVVGTSGLLISFNGTTWTRYPPAGSMILKDVFGKKESAFVWACGYAANQNDGILLQFDGTNWNTNWQNGQSEPSPYSGPLESLWYTGKDTIIVAGGAGVFWQDIEGNSPPRKDALSLGQYPYKVRGNAYNDIFISCARGRVWHFNGKTWRNYPELENPDHFFYSLAVQNDKVILIGLDISQGLQRLIIVSGQRE